MNQEFNKEETTKAFPALAAYHFCIKRTFEKRKHQNFLNTLRK